MIILAVRHTGRAADIGVDHGHQRRHVGRIRAAAAVRRGAPDGVFSQQLNKVGVHQILQIAARLHRQVARHFVDDRFRAYGVAAGFQRAVDLLRGVQDRLDGGAAHVGFDAHVRRHDVDGIAALGDDGMDADMVLVAERFALRVDGDETDLGRVERVDAVVG